MTQGTPQKNESEVALPRTGDHDTLLSPTNSADHYPVSNAEPQLSITIRLLSGALCLFLIAGFTLASKLEPSPRGYGTHQQLGLPPCSIQILFGIPCPSCGMTTSFSWFVRGQILNSARANIAGLYLAIICAILIPWTLVASLRGRCPFTNRIQLWVVILSGLYFLVAFVQWGVRFLLEAY